ncbi:ATP-binding protein [Streptomyces sp. NBC_00201]|uniref:ATP-binding protein n=1 Tax=unclassified Streptomyces TaxID=2593676 RepID=UPI0022542748|nr:MULTISPECIES: ATP-binding protein [unclassified Streptomyces]MCX5063482.1 ATP-binding protein [Streptomyces sp. NBC_00452]MCX5251636.1 ATP-binding protein [Streptomyces sp. NBC_00201]MCX5294439.1 ATP-binding protein [Streptomyces sp. NBC_00183]
MTAAPPSAALRWEVEHVFPLQHAARAVSAVRQRVAAVLNGWNLSAEGTDDVLLVVSELLTNAVVHALPPATLRVSRAAADGCRAVRVEVNDTGPVAPAGPSTSMSDPDEHGRGLDIVTALSARCGVQVHSGGTCRWAEVPVG